MDHHRTLTRMIRCGASLCAMLFVLSASRPAQAARCTNPHTEILKADHSFTTPSEALDTVDCWREAFEATGDRRAIFAIVYTDIIQRILDQVESGFFRDPEWMKRFVTELAELYRDAMFHYERGQGDVPEAWKIAFDASASGNALMIQELLVGINAHYNYDLAIAMYRAGMDENLQARRLDHLSLNEILGGAIDDVQQKLVRDYAPGLERLDEGLGQADEFLVSMLVHVALDFAWVNARRMTVLSPRWVRWELSQFSTTLGNLALLPNYYGPVLNKLHEIEGGYR